MIYVSDETRATVARDMAYLRKQDEEKRARLQREMQADWDRIRSQSPIKPSEPITVPTVPKTITQPLLMPAVGIKAPFPQRKPTIKRELLGLCGGSLPTATRLVMGHLACNPGKSEEWANEKAIVDLVRDRR